MKRYLPPLIGLLLLSACGDAPNGGPKPKPERQSPRVEVATVERQKTGRRIVQSGTLHAEREVKLITEEEGRIATLTVHEGDRVERGTLLLGLNDTLLNAQRRKAEAQRTQAALDLQRLQKLKRHQVVSEDELARARTALDVAKAEEELLQTRLAHTRIHAPFAGVISARLAEPGDAIARFTHVLTLTDDSRLLAKIQLSELLLPAVAVGDAVTLTLDALGEQTLTGSILRIYPTIDAVSRQGTLEILLTDPPPGARPGQLCRATLQLRPQPRLIIPFTALRRDTQGEYVFLVNADNTVQRTPVISGIHLGQHIEIVQGLEQGSQVVTKGFLGLGSGISVDVVLGTDSAS